MRIIFVRHAEAVDAEDFDGDDMERPLTAKGRTSAKRTFGALSAWLSGSDLVLSSEAVRARDTADLLATGAGLGKPIISSLLNPGCTRKQFKKLIKSLPKGASSFIVVGHEPDFSRLISQIVAAGYLDLRVKKGACIEIEMDEKFRGDLRMVVSPEIFKD
jgi:phosphohistidine phosphatase SixA